MEKNLPDQLILDAEPEKSVQELEREVTRLKKQLKRAELENDILKRRTSTSSNTANKICFY